MSLDYQVFAGQYIKIYLDEDLQMAGVASPTKLTRASEGDTQHVVFQKIDVMNLNVVAGRRTIRINYPAITTWGEIALDMVEVLHQDGIEEGTIQTGEEIGEAWTNDCITVGDVLSELESRSGYQCYIGHDWKLNFYEEKDPISDAPYEIVEEGEFNDFRNVQLEQDTDGYINKIFIVGGNDTQGNQLFMIKGNLAYQNAMQAITGGSGVYGHVHRDSAITEVDMRWTGAGTMETSVFLADPHNLQVGDFFWNKSLNKYSFVTDVPTDSSFTCEPVAGQDEAQAIHFFPSSYIIANNIMRAQGVRPTKLTFDTFTFGFEPQTTLMANIPKLGITEDKYFNIEEVQIKDMGAKIFKFTITAILRSLDSFSTKRRNTYIDWFRKSTSNASNRAGYGPVSGAINPPTTVSDTAPANPKKNDLWRDTSVSPAVWKHWDGASWEE